MRPRAKLGLSASSKWQGNDLLQFASCNTAVLNDNQRLCRWYHTRGKYYCSEFWLPSFRGNGRKSQKNEIEDSNGLLSRAGFVRQAYSGIFHMLPLGQRVQAKIEKLLDKYMRDLQAAKVSLSTLSSQELWSRSGRLVTGSDVFYLTDRKQSKWLLSPTHEEEITQLVGSFIQSYRDLPVRIYQISRKFRDEPRPRQGLLRGREFLMKDLYTFDVDGSSGLKTYAQVQEIYTRFFNKIKVPYIVAKADSGEMGGEISHEYHLPSAKGEDSIVSCRSCTYTKNRELVNINPVQRKPLSTARTNAEVVSPELLQLCETKFCTYDGKTLVIAFFSPREGGSSSGKPEQAVNPHAIKAAVPQVNIGLEDPLAHFQENHGSDKSILYVFDGKIGPTIIQRRIAQELKANHGTGLPVYVAMDNSGSLGISGIVEVVTGDQCPACSRGQLQVRKAIEIGHTFYLGQRYTRPLDVAVAVDAGTRGQHRTLVQMGCHGIGISRLIAAVASTLADPSGLNWPRALAPFEVVIIPHQVEDIPACDAVCKDLLGEDTACDDVLVDDRELDWLFKLRAADLIGYPVIVFLGKAWKQKGEYEVQCRQLNVKRNVSKLELPGFVKTLLERL